MDSAMPLAPAPAAGGAGRGGGAVIRDAKVWKLANDGRGESLAGEGTSFTGQACPVSQGGGDTYPLFPGENRASVAVATPGTMVNCGMAKSVEVLLQPGRMLLFRLVEKPGSRNLAAAGGDRFPLFPEKEPVAVAT